MSHVSEVFNLFFSLRQLIVEICISNNMDETVSWEKYCVATGKSNEVKPSAIWTVAICSCFSQKNCTLICVITMPSLH